jgi:hypothetical protein
MPRTISGSVGRMGKNLPADVTTVQELLNNVPADSGGPVPLLAVDGLAGPNTNSARSVSQVPMVESIRTDRPSRN